MFFIDAPAIFFKENKEKRKKNKGEKANGEWRVASGGWQLTIAKWQVRGGVVNHQSSIGSGVME